jgi:hypothetical protein
MFSNLSAFTKLHVVISLIGILSGLVVMLIAHSLPNELDKFIQNCSSCALRTAKQLRGLHQSRLRLQGER